MLDAVRLVLAALRSLLKSHLRLRAENVVLRHQLIVLRRTTPRRVSLTSVDRLLFVWLYRVWPAVLASVAILRPETVVRWHRQGFHAYWRWRSCRSPGRPRVAKDIRDLIREISLANPLWGAPRIHGEILKLGIEVSQTTVATYMARVKRPPSQSWLTFLRNHADGIASIDLFVVPTITFRMLFGFIVPRHHRRQLVFATATQHPTAEWIAQQISEAFPWESAPRYLIRDRDSSYGHSFKRRVRSMGIRDRPTGLRSPWRNCHAERLIGSVRRECLDHLIVINAAHLRRVLTAYADYYNTSRTHLALAKNAPFGRPIQSMGQITRTARLGGLHQTFTRIQ